MILIAHGVKNKNDAKFALKKGYNYLEIDVAKRIIFTKFTIMHGAIPGKLGFGPTLETLLTSKYKSKLFLDIKHASYSFRFTSRIVKLLELNKSQGIKICGPDWKVISNICRQTHAYPFYTLKDKNSFKKINQILPHIYKPSGFSINYKLIDEFLVRSLKSDYPNAQIWAWIVNHNDEVQRLQKLKIDGIITDNWRNQ